MAEMRVNVLKIKRTVSKVVSTMVKKTVPKKLTFMSIYFLGINGVIGSGDFYFRNLFIKIWIY